MPKKPPQRPKRTSCAKCTLKTFKCFRRLEEDEVRFLERFKAGELNTEPGASILLEGTSSPHLYTVLSGWAFRYKTLANGRRQILNFAMPGDFLGLQSSLFTEMHHSVEALTQMTLCVFPRERLWELYTAYPELSFDLTWLVARSERLLDENLLSVGQRSALERIAYILLHTFERANHLSLTQGNRMKTPFTQQHIADALGLSLVHTNKTLKALGQRGCVRWKDSTIEVIDERKLAEIAGYEPIENALRPIL
jgi:CRP/FNR family transcriptional regulator